MISEERRERIDLIERFSKRRRQRVIKLHEEGKQMHEIAKEMMIPESHVRYILTKT